MNYGYPSYIARQTQQRSTATYRMASKTNQATTGTDLECTQTSPTPAMREEGGEGIDDEASVKHSDRNIEKTHVSLWSTQRTAIDWTTRDPIYRRILIRSFRPWSIHSEYQSVPTRRMDWKIGRPQTSI